jgi:hypothetical protein
MENSDNNLENLTKKGMTRMDGVQAQSLMKYAFPVSKHGNAGASIWAAYRGLKLRTLRRARAIWNGEARRIDSWEMEALREAELKQARLEYVRARNRIEVLRQRVDEKHAHYHSA